MISKPARFVAATVIAVTVLAGTASTAYAQMPWVLIARKAAQRIQRMEVPPQDPSQPRQDFATVILEAPADRVFATALDLARKNSEVRILMTDPGARRLQLAQGDRVATLNVVELSPEVSQLLIAGSAGPNETPTASRVVGAVLRICAEMKKECSLAD
ncbi:hypothetical protein SAMN02745126_00539 [Enhydrobacter aerosaccus]|uniref:DUF4174 domain-containing protein n=1 Tax=Enhydrobacter aerosaccus TaxID=225324 RepID=A0A1T4JXA8_9HYPH|nr:hypothetical protein [Enhydrobacter aerosaccus]SJZ34665.1 hypothetical protein SAMN02745126_00539 [Enhydrobacter aerosaccus]